MKVNPHPNQYGIVKALIERCQQHGIRLAKQPSFDMVAKTVTMECAKPLEASAKEAIQTAFKAATLWELSIQQPVPTPT